MLVEDNQNLRKVLKDYLETLKFNVSDFSNGDAASESFERHRYDICIFDIVMQGKTCWPRSARWTSRCPWCS